MAVLRESDRLGKVATSTLFAFVNSPYYSPWLTKDFSIGVNMPSFVRGFLRNCAAVMLLQTGLLCLSDHNFVLAEEFATPTSTCWINNEGIVPDGSAWESAAAALDASMQYWLQRNLGRECERDNPTAGTITNYQYEDVVTGVRDPVPGVIGPVPSIYYRYVSYYCSTGLRYGGINGFVNSVRVLDGEYAGFPQCL